jgi:type IV secretory pathway TrbD component
VLEFRVLDRASGDGAMNLLIAIAAVVIGVLTFVAAQFGVGVWL